MKKDELYHKKLIISEIPIIIKKKGIIPKITTIVKRKKLEGKFEPSMKILVRITGSLLRKGNEGKSSLSLDAHLNYTRLAKHIVWMEKKGLVQSKIEESKIIIGLTEKGRLFTSIISS